MTELVKFVFVMLNFIFLFLAAKNVDGMPFLSFSNFLLYFVPNILSHFSYIFLFSHFITTGVICFKDSDCPLDLCSYPFKPKCDTYGYCRCQKYVTTRFYGHMIHYLFQGLREYIDPVLEYAISCHMVIVVTPNNLNLFLFLISRNLQLWIYTLKYMVIK